MPDRGEEGPERGSLERLQQGVSPEYGESKIERGIKPSKPAHLAQPQPVPVPRPPNEGHNESADKK
jgi:hypothetical protein